MEARRRFDAQLFRESLPCPLPHSAPFCILHSAFPPCGCLIQFENPLEERVVLVEPLLEGQGGVGVVIVEQLVERGLDPHLHIVVVRVLGGPGAG